MIPTQFLIQTRTRRILKLLLMKTRTKTLILSKIMTKRRMRIRILTLIMIQTHLKQSNVSICATTKTRSKPHSHLKMRAASRLFAARAATRRQKTIHSVSATSGNGTTGKSIRFISRLRKKIRIRNGNGNVIRGRASCRICIPKQKKVWTLLSAVVTDCLL